MMSFSGGSSKNTNSGRAVIAKIVACQLLGFQNA